MNGPRNHLGHRAPRPGFTLLELIVVIGVIALLTTIVLTIGPKVLGGQKESGTQNILRALDRVYDDYLGANGGAQPFFDVNDYAGVPGKDLKVFEDGKNETVDGSLHEAFSSYPPSGSGTRDYPRFPDAAVFLRQALAAGVGDGVLATLPARSIVLTATEDDPGAPADEADRTPSILDLWGPADNAWTDNGYTLLGGVPVLFVHPSNLFAQEMYGACLNGRAYFMSAGPDRLYGATNQLTEDGSRGSNETLWTRAVQALSDNIYSTRAGPADTRNNNGSYAGTFTEQRR